MPSVDVDCKSGQVRTPLANRFPLSSLSASPKIPIQMDAPCSPQGHSSAMTEFLVDPSHGTDRGNVAAHQQIGQHVHGYRRDGHWWDESLRTSNASHVEGHFFFIFSFSFSPTKNKKKNEREGGGGKRKKYVFFVFCF